MGDGAGHSPLLPRPYSNLSAHGRPRRAFIAARLHLLRSHHGLRRRALANLAIIEREGLQTRARTLEGVFAAALAPLVEHPLVSEVRTGVGLLGAVQLDPVLVERDASLPGRAAASCRTAGVITRALAGGGLQLSPPLVIDEDQIGELAAGLRSGLDAVA